MEVNGASSPPSNEYIDINSVIDGLFPYDEPYDDQYEGIKSTIENFRRGGVSVIEGPCGTGKTLISLISALGVIRDPTTDYEQALIVTSVKQQQAAFEEDIQTINESILDTYGYARDAPAKFQPVTGLSLVGKADLCPYTDSGAIDREYISPRCSSLISNTINQASKASVSGGDSKVDGARDIVLAAQSRLNDVGVDEGSSHYETITNPEHPPEPIEFSGESVCPYYSQYIVDDEIGNDKVKYQWSMLDANTLRQKASQLGTCPYMAMRDGIANSEIIIGNYAHIFHEPTVEAITNTLLNNNTLLIVDEAHMLTEKVREYETVDISYTDVLDTIEEIDLFLEGIDSVSVETEKAAFDELRRYDTTIEDVKKFKQLVTELSQMVKRVVGSHIQGRHPDYEENIPFRNPDVLKDDRFDKWLEYINISDELIQDSKYCAKAISGGLRHLSDELEHLTQANYNTEEVGKLITKKWYGDNAEYFFEITLSGNEPFNQWSYTPDEEPQENYNIQLTLHNCMPANEVRRVVSQFGGALIMSATLNPLDVYSDTIGVSDIEKPLSKKQFDVRFPRSNRGSYIVPLTPFKKKNRGCTTDSNKTRKQYRSTIIDIIQNAKGNTLVCMPSYEEAEWIAGEIDDDLPNPTYKDMSSTNEETQALKQAFEKEDSGVLVTSLRGTLTEGVDYSGDKLSNVIVAGVPLSYPYSNEAKAVQTAFAVKFGRKNAFDYSHTLPAVYKTRQALGRVIRTSSDVGTRVLIDERYTNDHHQSVHEYLTPQEQEEYDVTQPDDIGDTVADFWMGRDV